MRARALACLIALAGCNSVLGISEPGAGSGDDDAPRCGDGIVDPGEDCDGAMVPSCGDATGGGLPDGTTACSADCTVDTSACHACDNGTIEGDETCDADDLAGATCEALGFDFGTLGCDACALDTSGCTTCAPLAACDTACVDTGVDLANCGSCGHACAASEACSDADCRPPALLTVRPTTVRAGDTMILEGVFGPGATVTFPGSAPVAATMLGTQRAQVIVPATATTGDVTVTARGVVSAPVRVRVASFGLTLNVFRGTYEQAGYAQQTPTLIQGRTGGMAIRTGRWLYVLGGTIGGVATTSIERALVNGDGSLGPFAAAGNLRTARAFATITRVGDRVFVVGGTGPGGNLASVEQATIAPDDTLGAFTASPAALATARSGHAAAIIGRWLYVIGGTTVIERAPVLAGGLGPFETASAALTLPRSRPAVEVAGGRVVVIGGDASGAALSSIEEATIDGEGDLGSFAVAATSLASPRTGAASAIVGDALYLIGGSDGTRDLTTVERAPIAGDGSLQAFASLPGLETARQSPALAVIDNFLYVLAGSARPTFERASIIGAHTIGQFGEALDPSEEPRSRRGLFTLGSALFNLSGGRKTSSNGLRRASVSLGGLPSQFAQLPITGVTPGRNDPGVAIVGSNIYVLGGTFDPGVCCDVTTNVARAPIDGSGNVGNFGDAGTPLTVDRNGAAVAVIGSTMFVIGGGNDRSLLRSIERAPIGTGGLLGSFAAIGSQLVTARSLAASVVLGDKIYVVGGQVSGSELASIEVATVAGPNLGSFATATVSLNTARLGPATAVIGDRLYVLGGANQGQQVQTVEVATIAPDGTLGPFSVVPGFLSNLSTGAGSALIQDELIVGSPPQLAPLGP